MRWKVICAYDGTEYQGWQTQPNGSSVQNRIQSALKEVLKRPIQIYGSGRTDRGVHAKGQVFHFDAEWSHSALTFKKALQRQLPLDITIRSIVKIRNDFHAQYSAVKKRYVYTLYFGVPLPMEARYVTPITYALDLPKMQKAASYLIGTHDFAAFCANRGALEPLHYRRHLLRLDLIHQGPRLRFVTEADGYLYKMVRSLVGILIEVGRGKLKALDVQKVLITKKRTEAVVTVPAKGLCLDRVFY